MKHIKDNIQEITNAAKDIAAPAAKQKPPIRSWRRNIAKSVVAPPNASVK